MDMLARARRRAYMYPDMPVGLRVGKCGDEVFAGSIGMGIVGRVVGRGG